MFRPVEANSLWAKSYHVGSIAGVHAEGPLGGDALGRILTGREAHLELVAGQPREDLGRCDRQRGEKLCESALRVVR